MTFNERLQFCSLQKLMRGEGGRGDSLLYVRHFEWCSNIKLEERKKRDNSILQIIFGDIKSSFPLFIKALKNLFFTPISKFSGELPSQNM